MGSSTNHLYSSLVEADLATGVSGGSVLFLLHVIPLRTSFNKHSGNQCEKGARQRIPILNFTGRIVDVSMDRLMDGDEMAFHLCEVSQGYGQLEASVCGRLVTTACCLVGMGSILLEPQWCKRTFVSPFTTAFVRVGTHVGWRWMAEGYNRNGNSCEMNWLDREPDRERSD